MITVTINGKKVLLEAPVTVLAAARTAGIHIPTLCHNDLLEAFGGCRLCLVEIEKVSRLQTACTQFVTDGMVVSTETDRVVEARRAVLEFLLINHPLDCPYCDKAGECDLQDLAVKYGPATGRFAEGKRTHPESFEDPLIIRNMERCILCSKCVRMCADLQRASAISIINRGARSSVEPFSGGKYDCEYCGNCLTVCPVGAIMSRAHRHDYRPWLIDKEAETVCSYCGVGCTMVLQMRGNSLIRAVPRIGLGLNKGLLCSRGRFGYDFLQSSERLDAPLIRRNGELRQATWAEAVAYMAQRLKQILADKGGDAIAGIASGRSTNEDIYVFQKFFRLVLDSNNVDSVAGVAYGPAQKMFEKIFGQGVTANLIHGISRSDGVLVVGGDPASVNPVLGLEIRAAHKKEVPVVVLGYARGLESFSRHKLRANPFTEPVLLAALVSEMRKRKDFSGERTFFEAMIKDLEPMPLKDACEMSGIKLSDFMDVVTVLSGMSNPSIVIGRDIVQTSSGHSSLLLLAALVSLLNGRIYLMSEFPNEQGLLDMGCQPDILPCGRPMAVETYKKRCEELLGVEVPSNRGRNLVEIIEGAHAGTIEALYIMGDNIALSLPDANYVREALENVEFLVVHDLFLSETAHLADVVLPALSWAEKEGSYTNLERRIQLTRKSIDRKGPEEWKVLAQVSEILGFDMGYGSVEDIFREIARVSLIYRGLSYQDLRSGKCLWPYKGEPLRHDAHPEDMKFPDWASLTAQYEAGRIHLLKDSCLFHSEHSSRYSSLLKSIAPEPYVRISGMLAERASVAQGDYVTVSTGSGRATVRAHIDPYLPEDAILMPNFESQGIFQIIAWKTNPVIRTFAFDGNEAVIVKQDM